MLDLKQSLQSHDLGHMRIVAEFWGLELQASDPREVLEELTVGMIDRTLVEEVFDTLPEEARTALDELLIYGGRIPWPRFTRQFGEVREMGPGRRDRERPYYHPISPAETLWYRGLVGRAFFDSESGPEEYAYIPENLIPLLPEPQGDRIRPLGRPASRKEHQHQILVSDRILDDACTLLAALRVGKSPQSFYEFSCHPDASPSPSSLFALTSDFLITLLAAASILDAGHMPQPEPTRAFLECDRGESLAMLVRAWLDSATLNELHLIPDLIPEGEWDNSPLQARRTILTFLSSLPEGTWWSLDGLVAGIRENHPDFQRTAGDYDSWFIKKRDTGEYLRGFEHWDEVDGKLIRYLITGPMHWLGLVDLASPEAGGRSAAFRFSRWSSTLLKADAPKGLPEENGVVKVTSRAWMRVPRLASRAARYQIARFSIWEKVADDVYEYRITPISLERAREQGLQVSHLEALLQRHAQTIPPSLVKALKRWESRGSEIRVERRLILRVKSVEILKKIRSSRAARFLGDPLGPTAVIVKEGAWEKVLNILAELGYLGEADIEV